MNDWFDLFNVGTDPTKPHPPFGQEFNTQKDILQKTTTMVDNMLVHNKVELLPFQKGKYTWYITIFVYYILK